MIKLKDEIVINIEWNEIKQIKMTYESTFAHASTAQHNNFVFSHDSMPIRWCFGTQIYDFVNLMVNLCTKINAMIKWNEYLWFKNKKQNENGATIIH